MLAQLGPQYHWNQVLYNRWWIAAIALGVSIVATPIVRHIAYRLKVVDRPDALLKPHGRPIAYLGGVAMCVGLLSGLAGYLSVLPNLSALWDGIGGALGAGDVAALLLNPLWNLLFVALAAVAITLVGLLDDLYSIRPGQKILGQLVVAALLLMGGVGTRMGAVFLEPMGLAEVPWLLYPLSGGMVCFAVIICCNATNLLDGLDGLCGGVSAIIGLGFLALAVYLAMWGNTNPEMDALRVSLALAMVGAILGFLPYNTHPASIFMGDAGSMLLGFLVATMMALFCHTGNPRWFMASVVVFAVPVMDTMLAVVRRLLAGRSIFAGDRSHLYDQLIDRGVRLRRVVGLFYLLSLLAAGIGVGAAVYLRTRYALVLHLGLFALVWLIFRRMGVIREEASRTRRAHDVGPTAPVRPAVGSEEEPLNLLFTSVGRRVSLVHEFRRAARDLRVSLTIHAADHLEMAPALQVADHKAIVPSIRTDGYVQAILDYCRTHAIHALIPLIDTELLPLSNAADRFREVGTEPILSSHEVVSIARDKILTAEFLLAHGFLTPRILSPEEFASATYPLFVKPRRGSASQGIRKVNDARELEMFLATHPDSIVQEFIAGQEYTVDVFADLGGTPRCAVPRLRHETRSGEVSKGETVRHARIIDASMRLVRELGGCRGMVTIQCFLTPDGRIVFIEINPRFGGGVPLSIRAGADSPRWILELLLGRDVQIDASAWRDHLLMLRYDEAIFLPADQLPRGNA